MEDLDAFEGDVNLGKLVDSFLSSIQKPEIFLNASEEHCKAAKQATKALYDFAALSLGDVLLGKLPFKQLHVDGFDTEQVWGQIALFSKQMDKRTKRLLRKIGPDAKLLTEVAENDIDALLGGSGKDGESLSEDAQEASSTSDLDGSVDSMQSGESMDEPSASEEAVDITEKNLLPTEDAFFQLDQMETFVEEAELQDPEGEGGGELGAFDDESDPELNEHLFAAQDKESDMSDGQEDPDEEGMKQGHEILFDDFFKKQPKQNKSSGKKLANSKGPGVSEAGKGVIDHPISSGTAALDMPTVKPISNQELSSLTLGRQIVKLEESALAAKPWPLQGEVRAGDRPLNSALEVDLDFETTVRPPPEPTEEATESLEVLIKRRIADHSFDDVVRIVPPPIEKKRKLIELDDSQGKQGLGEVYEADYVRTVTGGGVEDKDEGLRKEARKLFKELSLSLDALTHFHFAPKPVIEEMEIKVDVPAIVMEEALPVRVSDATMKAPEDVYRSKASGGDIHGENERSQEERKRLRRQLKRRFKNREKDTQNGGEDGSKIDAKEGRRDRKSLKKITKRGRAHDGSGVDYGKSREVFRTLQEERDGGKPRRIKADIAVPSRAAQLKL